MTTANIMIATVCNRRCPKCCCADIVHGSPPRFFSAEAIADEVALLDRAEVIYLTGGEPTLHPDFDNVLRLSRKARGEKLLFLMTNGAKLSEKASATAFVNRVCISILDGYSKNILKNYLRVKPKSVIVDPWREPHYATTGGDRPCHRHLTTISVMDGLVYPCCVACGIRGAESTPLTAEWPSLVRYLRPPCGNCVFGQKI